MTIILCLIKDFFDLKNLDLVNDISQKTTVFYQLF